MLCGGYSPRKIDGHPLQKPPLFSAIKPPERRGSSVCPKNTLGFPDKAADFDWSWGWGRLANSGKIDVGMCALERGWQEKILSRLYMPAYLETFLRSLSYELFGCNWKNNWQNIVIYRKIRDSSFKIEKIVQDICREIVVILITERLRIYIYVCTYIVSMLNYSCLYIVYLNTQYWFIWYI